MSNSKDTEHQPDEDWISKSQVKKEMHDLQSLGERLCQLSTEKRKGLPVGELMQAAFEEYDRIKSKEARRRHIQYIGKLMRTEDIDLLQKSMDLLDPNSDLQGQLTNQAEQWRLRFLGDDSKNQITAFLTQHPNADAQLLRQLLRNANSESKKLSNENNLGLDQLAAQTKSGKKLFKLLRQALVDDMKGI